MEKETSCFKFNGDIQSWFEINYENNTVFRYWTKDMSEDAECEFAVLTQLIDLKNGDYLIGFSPLDDEAKNKRYNGIDFHKLSELTITLFDADQEE